MRKANKMTEEDNKAMQGISDGTGFEDADVPIAPTSEQPSTMPSDVAAAYAPQPVRTSSPFIATHGTKIRKITGVLCIAVPLIALVLGLVMAFSNSFPSTSFEFDDGSGKYVRWSQARYDELLATIDSTDAAMDETAWNSDEHKAAEADNKTAQRELREFRMHLLSSFLFSWGLFPCLALFVAWFVFAIKTKNSPYAPLRTRDLVIRTIAFVVGGCIFFNVVPGILFDFVNNIGMILLCAALCVIAFFVIKLSAGSGSGSAPITVNGGKTTVPKNTPAGAVMKKQDKYRNITGKKDPTRNENLAGMRDGAKVKTVHSSQKLRRAESVAFGKYIGIADGKETHYVCSQHDYDKGKVVIIDQHGRVRKA